MSPRLSLLIKCIGSIGLLWLIFQKVDFARFATTIEQADVGPLWAAGLIFIVIRYLMGVRLWIVARCFDINPSMHACIAMVYSSAVAGFVLPGGVATDVVRGFQLSRLFNNPAAALSAVVLDRFFGIVAMLIVGCVFWQLAPPSMPSVIGWFLYLAAAGCLLLSVAGPAILSRLPNLHPWIAKAQQLAAVILEQMRFSKNYLYLFLLSVVIQLLRCSVYIMLFAAFNLSIDPLLAFVVVPILFIIIMIPFSIGGLGVREGVLIFLFVPLGAEVEPLALVGFAAHLIEFITTLPGLWYLWRGIPGSKEAKATAPD